MKKGSGPVREFPLANQVRQDFIRERKAGLPDFSNTALTFRHLSDARLLGTRRLFRLMGNPLLTSLLGKLGVRAVDWSPLERELAWRRSPRGRLWAALLWIGADRLAGRVRDAG